MRPEPGSRLRHGALIMAFAALGGIWGGSATAFTPGFPGPAVATTEHSEALGSYPLPIGPWAEGSMITRRTEGALRKSAWRIDSPGITTLELMAPLRDQLAEAGFRTIYECESDGCGGFDFRYSTPILPEPDMHVDLGDFRFVAAGRGMGDGAEYLSLMVSRSSRAGFVQLVRVGQPPEPEPLVTASTRTPEPAEPGLPRPDPEIGDLALLLEAGAVPLDDLSFETGAATLEAGEFASLAMLAAYLHTHPDRALALVGHTDAEGGLKGNIALSKRRAEAVRDRLIRDHGVPPVQVTAEGVGFLSPRDSNLTDEGRMRNRRVEAMLTSTR